MDRGEYSAHLHPRQEKQTLGVNSPAKVNNSYSEVRGGFNFFLRIYPYIPLHMDEKFWTGKSKYSFEIEE